MSIQRLFRRFLKANDGATAIEYGLIAALLGVSIIAGAGALGNNLSGLFFGVSNTLDETLN